MTRWITLVLLSGGLGCAAVAAGAGAAGGAAGYAWYKGELKHTVTSGLNPTYDATEAALERLEFPITHRKKDGVYAEVEARTVRNQQVRVKLEESLERKTTVTIRIGTFGDEDLSRRVLAEIEQGLSDQG